MIARSIRNDGLVCRVDVRVSKNAMGFRHQHPATKSAKDDGVKLLAF